MEQLLAGPPPKPRKKPIFVVRDVRGDTFGAEGDKFQYFEFYDTKEDVPYDCTDEEWAKAEKHKLPYSVKVESLGETAKLTLTRLANY